MNLDDKLLYRLIKSVYVVCIVLLASLSIYNFDTSIPDRMVDANLSYVSCINGNKYSFDDAGIDIYPPQVGLREENFKSAVQICKNHGTSFYPDLSHPVSSNFPESYKVQYWPIQWPAILDQFISAALIFLASYIFINIIKEGLIYIIFGRVFQWRWLGSKIIKRS